MQQERVIYWKNNLFVYTSCRQFVLSVQSLPPLARELCTNTHHLPSQSPRPPSPPNHCHPTLPRSRNGTPPGDDVRVGGVGVELHLHSTGPMKTRARQTTRPLRCSLLGSAQRWPRGGRAPRVSGCGPAGACDMCRAMNAFESSLHTDVRVFHASVHPAVDLIEYRISLRGVARQWMWYPCGEGCKSGSQSKIWRFVLFDPS